VNVQIDHVTVCGRDLDRMRQTFAEIGLTTEYGGPHANGLTHMALVGFDDGSYLELIAPLNGRGHRAVEGASGMMAGWLPLMLGDAGAAAWAIRADRIHETAERLRQQGIAIFGPERGGRTKPDGTQLEWETALLGPGPAGSVLPFMIEDRTERSLRIQPSTPAREAGIRGLAAVILAVHDLSATAASFQKAFNVDSPSLGEDFDLKARLAHFRGTPVILATPVQSSSPIQLRLDRFGEGPMGFLFSRTWNEPSARTSQWFGQQLRWFKEKPGTGLLGMLDAS